MNVDKVDNLLEKSILAVVLGILVWGPIYLGGATRTGFLGIMALTTLALLLWVGRLWVKKEFHILVPAIIWPVVIFTAYAVFRYFTAPVEYVARWEILRVLVYAALFFIVLANLYRQSSIEFIVSTLIFLGAIIAGYAGLQYLTGAEHVLWFKNSYAPRAGGTFYCPNHLAGFLELIIPLAIAFIFSGRQSPTMKVLYGYAVLLMLAGMVVTISRGGWVACGISLVLVFGILAWQRVYRIPALVMATIIVAIGVYLYSKNLHAQIRIERSIETFEFDRDARTLVWKSALDMWSDHKWLGVGPGHFDVRFREYRHQLVQQRPGWVHNDYIQTLTEWGIVGASIVLVWLGMLISLVIRMWRFVVKQGDDFSRPSSNRFAFVLGACGAFTAILIHSYVDFNMHIPANAILVIVLGGLLVSHVRFATERYWRTIHMHGRVGLTIIVLGLCLVFVTQTIRGGREQFWQTQAEKASRYSSAQVEALRKAFEIEPRNFDTAYIIGEAYRVLAMSDIADPEPVVREAMQWYERAMQLNPYDPYNYLRYGMCLDLLERYHEAESWLAKAVDLDPNGYYVVGHVGWHYAQVRNYAAAKPWLERSRRLLPQRDVNTIAYSYLNIVDRRLQEFALSFKPVR